MRLIVNDLVKVWKGELNFGMDWKLRLEVSEFNPEMYNDKRIKSSQSTFPNRKKGWKVLHENTLTRAPQVVEMKHIGGGTANNFTFIWSSGVIHHLCSETDPELDCRPLINTRKICLAMKINYTHNSKYKTPWIGGKIIQNLHFLKRQTKKNKVSLPHYLDKHKLQFSLRSSVLYLCALVSLKCECPFEYKI